MPRGGPPVDSRWTVTVAGKDRRANKGPDCHPLQYFLDSNNLKEFDYSHGLLGPYPADIKDDVHSERRGEIDGFAIYDVIHEIDNGRRIVPGESFSFPATVLKMVLAERQPGELCEIYHEQDLQDDLVVTPSYFVDVDSERVLVTHDRITGIGNDYDEAYWTFDKDGPILLDFQSPFAKSKAFTIAEKLLPAGMHVRRGGGFDIQTLSYDMPVWQDGAGNFPTGGHVHVEFAIKDHELVVVSQEYSKPRSDQP